MWSLPKLRILSLVDLPSSLRTWILENFLHAKLIATSLEGLVHKKISSFSSEAQIMNLFKKKLATVTKV